MGASIKPAPKRLIGELLVAEGLVTMKQVTEALVMQRNKGGKIVANLIALGHLTPRAFLNFLARQPGMASIDLLNYAIPREVIELIPAEFAIKHEIMPLDRMGQTLTLGMACPLDAETMVEVVAMTGLRVKPLLVSIDDVRTAITRYYSVQPQAHTLAGQEHAPPPIHPTVEAEPKQQQEQTLAQVESALNFEYVRNLVRQATALPALPETLVGIQGMMDDPEATTVSMARVIGRDPALAGKLLSLANSSVFGFQHHVETVELAASLLGMRETYALAMSSAVIDYFDKSKRFDYKGFWRRSMICAMAAKIIAKACGRRDSDSLAAAGLLHDLGRLVFSEVAAERYQEDDLSVPDSVLIPTELDRFGVAHPEIGFVLAETWNLPEEMAAAIRFHHAFEQAAQHEDYVAVVALAARMVDTHSPHASGQGASPSLDYPVLLARLKLHDSDFEAVLSVTNQLVRSRFA